MQSTKLVASYFSSETINSNSKYIGSGENEIMNDEFCHSVMAVIGSKIQFVLYLTTLGK